MRASTLSEVCVGPRNVPPICTLPGAALPRLTLLYRRGWVQASNVTNMYLLLLELVYPFRSSSEHQSIGEEPAGCIFRTDGLALKVNLEGLGIRLDST